MGGGLLGPPGLKKICFLWGFQDPAGAVHPPFENMHANDWYVLSPGTTCPGPHTLELGTSFFILEIVMNFRSRLKNFRSLAYSYSIVGYRDKEIGCGIF